MCDYSTKPGGRHDMKARKHKYSNPNGVGRTENRGNSRKGRETEM